MKFHFDFDFDFDNAESITDSFIQKCQNKVEKKIWKWEKNQNGPDINYFKQAINFTVKFDLFYIVNIKS